MSELARIAAAKYAWEKEAATRRERLERFEAWGRAIYLLPPALRPYGQRGQYPKPPYVHDADGSRLCRWCGVKVAQNRWWCGPECVAGFMSRGDWKTIARAVEKRDQVCRICRGERFAVSVPRRTYWYRDAPETWRNDPGGWHSEACALRGSGFAVDHIIAVRDGGDDHPDNLRLLCVRCHLEVTAAQHARWARERREEKRRRDPPPEQPALL